jgi:hypothetical protein
MTHRQKLVATLLAWIWAAFLVAFLLYEVFVGKR